MDELPRFANTRDIQRNYRTLFDQIKKTKKPLIVLRGDQPDVAIIDIKQFEELSAIASAIRSLKQIKGGKAKHLSSLADLTV